MRVLPVPVVRCCCCCARYQISQRCSFRLARIETRCVRRTRSAAQVRTSIPRGVIIGLGLPRTHDDGEEGALLCPVNGLWALLSQMSYQVSAAAVVAMGLLFNSALHLATQFAHTAHRDLPQLPSIVPSSIRERVRCQ